MPTHPNSQSLKYRSEHLGVASMDTSALCQWYQRVLGARLIWTDEKTPPAFLLELNGGLVIEIYPANSSAGNQGDNKSAGWRHLALRVDDIEQASQQLEGLGIMFNEPVKPAGGGGKVRFFSDPEGNLLHLVERLQPALFPLKH